jgi:hypothetical protein
MFAMTSELSVDLPQENGKKNETEGKEGKLNKKKR